jgi:hypothetical protein
MPPCASSDLQLTITDFLSALDATLLAAQRWQDGITDGTQATMEFYEAETKLRHHRLSISKLVATEAK